MHWAAWTTASIVKPLQSLFLKHMLPSGAPQVDIALHWSRPRFNCAATNWPESNDRKRFKGKPSNPPRERSRERSMPDKRLVSESEVLSSKNELQPVTPICRPKSKQVSKRLGKLLRSLKSAIDLVYFMQGVGETIGTVIGTDTGAETGVATGTWYGTQSTNDLLATKTTKLLHQGGLNVLSRTFRARSCGNKSVVASATTAANATVAIFVTYDAIIATNYPKHKYVVV